MNAAGVGHQSTQAPAPQRWRACGDRSRAEAVEGVRRPTNSRCGKSYLASTPLLRMPDHHLNASSVWQINMLALGTGKQDNIDSERFLSF
jgi:hypothetical protein